VTREISRVDVASLVAPAAARIRPADIEPLVASVARWAAAQIPPGAGTELVSWVRGLLLSRPLAPILAEIADVAHRNGWDQRLVDALAQTLVDTLDRPDVRAAVGDLADEVVGSYRQRMGLYPGLLIRVANALGLIDTDRLVSALRAALVKVAEDPDDPLRRRLSGALAELPRRLRTEPDLAARVEATKTELLASPAIGGLIEDAATALGRAVVIDLEGHRSELVAWITGQIEQARETLVSDEAVRRSLDRWLKQHATSLVARYQSHLAAFIERGIHALGAEGAARLIEEHAGDDLQYIRVNGTVVGGFAGGGIYALHLLIDLL
jgi:uncharacterized membrane-anchored protein YjiN (DUF445 family)